VGEAGGAKHLVNGTFDWSGNRGYTTSTSRKSTRPYYSSPQCVDQGENSSSRQTRREGMRLDDQVRPGPGEVHRDEKLERVKKDP